MMAANQIFDRLAVRQHRDRAAKNFAENNFLFAETASRLGDRLDDINRRFQLGLDLGSHCAEIAKCCSNRHHNIKWIRTDLSPNFAKLAIRNSNAPALAMDEELFTFKNHVFDLVISNLSLHWLNDFPGALSQIFRTLKPDGLFLASFLGEQTLFELQQSFYQAEIEVEGGVSPRISPFAQLKDAGNLLVRAGFTLPVADAEQITVQYPDALNLMRDLRSMGETNSNKLRRKTFSKRETLMRTIEIYHSKFRNKKGTIPATFEIICLTGWAPHQSQQQALKPGTGQIDFEMAINTLTPPNN